MAGKCFCSLTNVFLWFKMESFPNRNWALYQASPAAQPCCVKTLSSISAMRFIRIKCQLKILLEVRYNWKWEHHSSSQQHWVIAFLILTCEISKNDAVSLGVYGRERESSVFKFARRMAAMLLAYIALTSFLWCTVRSEELMKIHLQKHPRKPK